MNDSSPERLGEIFDAAGRTPLAPFSIGDREFRHHPETEIMGVINLSTDSWYRESVATSSDSVRRKSEIMRSEGAAVIDLGLKSSRHADTRIDDSEMKKKLTDSLRQLRKGDLVISIDTDDPEFAKIALDGGAAILNVTTTDENGEFEAFLRLRDEYDAAIIACFTPVFPEAGSEEDPELDSIFPALEKIAADFRERGIERAWLDPGLGFSARIHSNHVERIRAQLHSLFDSHHLRRLGFPVCQSMPNAFECFQEHVTSAEVLFGSFGYLGGADLIRTHEPGKMASVIKTVGTLKV